MRWTVRLLRAVIWYALIWSVEAGAEEAISKAKLASVTYAAFQCGMYANISENYEESERLFQLGISTGRDFVEAALNKEITPEQFKKEVPIGVSLVLQGPTVDFIIGRVYQSITNDAYEGLYKMDDSGLPIPQNEWNTDGNLIKIRAANKFQSKNCKLLR